MVVGVVFRLLRHRLALPIWLFGIGFFSLSMAFIAEYGFDLKPCILCLYQRVPFAVLVGLGLLGGLVLGFNQKAVKWLLPSLAYGGMLVLLIGAGIATYHTGVEWKWFSGPTSCSLQDARIPDSVEELQAMILATKPVRCDTPEFVFLGLSMAGWNVLWSLGLVVSVWLLYRIVHPSHK